MTSRPLGIVAAAAVASLIALAPAVAHADARSDAAALFREAKAAFDRKSYRAAALGFEEANRRAPAPAAIYNAAVAWRREGSLDRAADDFAEALADPSFADPERADSQKNLREIEKSVGVVEVVGPAGATVTVGHVAGAPVPRRIHLVPGDHTVSVSVAGAAPVTKSVRVRAGAVDKVDLDAGAATPLASSAPPVVASSAPSVVAPPPPPAEPPPPATTGPSTSTVLAIGSFGLAAVGLGAGAIFGVKTLSARDDYEATGFTDADARDTTIANRTATNVAFVAAGVFAITGVVLLLTQGSSSGGGGKGDRISGIAPRRALGSW